MLSTGIILMVLGAILKFAVADAVEGVDLGMIGLILLIAGAVALLIGIIQSAAGRRASSTTVVQDGAGQRTAQTDSQLPPRDV